MIRQGRMGGMRRGGRGRMLAVDDMSEVDGIGEGGERT